MEYLRSRYVNIDDAPIIDLTLDAWLAVFEDALATRRERLMPRWERVS